jgi:hypothetical protein
MLAAGHRPAAQKMISIGRPLALQYSPLMQTFRRGSSVPILLQKSLMVSPNSDCVTSAHKRLLMNEAGIVKPPEISSAFKVSIALENSQIVFDPATFDRAPTRSKAGSLTNCHFVRFERNLRRPAAGRAEHRRWERASISTWLPARKTEKTVDTPRNGDTAWATCKPRSHAPALRAVLSGQRQLRPVAGKP